MSKATDRVQLPPSWKHAIGSEFDQPYMRTLRQFLSEEKQLGKTVLPPGKEIFNALNLTPFDDIKVVILGQDPYHGLGQAHGLCFSVRPGVPLPPSLKNIFTELRDDVGVVNGDHGCLLSWAQQGVLLLNSVLTVVKGLAASHQGKGWEQLTNAIVTAVNAQREGIVFMLWGNHAQKKGDIIDPSRHRVLKSAHPSPFSASRGFFGNRHFSQANAYLRERGQLEINWQLPPLPVVQDQMELARQAVSESVELDTV